MVQWNKFSESKPPVGIEVVAYNSKWVNKDFNPNGQRVGFLTEDGDFISAYWWDYQDDYVAISHSKCDGNPNFGDSNNTMFIEPEYWTDMPIFSQE